MTKKLKDVGASVRSRLLELSKTRGDDFQLVLVRYVNERLLFRIASSPHAKTFILKGAALFTVWTGKPHRATRDLDLLGSGDASEDHVIEVFLEILDRPVEDDGVSFDRASLVASPIREDQEYGGVRLTLAAHVAAAKVRVQVDIGFGDAVTPAARAIDFPSLLEFPAPRLRAYPRETVVAEKVEAMVKLGLANTRMKDFYDLRVMSHLFAFEGALLVKALRATFTRRGTPFPNGAPPALTPAFFDDKSRREQWAAFAKKTGARDAGELEDAIDRVAGFCSQPLLVAAEESDWAGTWKPGGPWRR
ncbi:MAG: nucleotidyl transferase AbiEii/AbiGii toxin family protein [Archangium sp.]|nr:nucleotidyl transferase AbiEii/AbiGii toxin family protein [Archangium sp.]